MCPPLGNEKGVLLWLLESQGDNGTVNSESDGRPPRRKLVVAFESHRRGDPLEQNRQRSFSYFALDRDAIPAESASVVCIYLSTLFRFDELHLTQ